MMFYQAFRSSSPPVIPIAFLVVSISWLLETVVASTKVTLSDNMNKLTGGSNLLGPSTDLGYIVQRQANQHLTRMFSDNVPNSALQGSSSDLIELSTRHDNHNNILSQNATDSSNWSASRIYNIFLVALLMSLILISIIGNCLVCVAIFTERKLRKLGNAFIVSLAIADLFVSCLVMTFALCNDLLEYWIFGDWFCDVWISFDIMCCTASILNLCAISLDRFILIKDCLLYNRWMTRRVALTSLILIWFISALVSFVPINLGWHKPPNPIPSSFSQASFPSPQTTTSILQAQSSKAIDLSSNMYQNPTIIRDQREQFQFYKRSSISQLEKPYNFDHTQRDHLETYRKESNDNDDDRDDDDDDRNGSSGRRSSSYVIRDGRERRSLKTSKIEPLTRNRMMTMMKTTTTKTEPTETTWKVTRDTDNEVNEFHLLMPNTFDHLTSKITEKEDKPSSLFNIKLIAHTRFRPTNPSRSDNNNGIKDSVRNSGSDSSSSGSSISRLGRSNSDLVGIEENKNKLESTNWEKSKDMIEMKRQVLEAHIGQHSSLTSHNSSSFSSPSSYLSVPDQALHLSSGISLHASSSMRSHSSQRDGTMTMEKDVKTRNERKENSVKDKLNNKTRDRQIRLGWKEDNYDNYNNNKLRHKNIDSNTIFNELPQYPRVGPPSTTSSSYYLNDNLVNSISNLGSNDREKLGSLYRTKSKEDLRTGTRIDRVNDANSKETFGSETEKPLRFKRNLDIDEIDPIILEQANNDSSDYRRSMPPKTGSQFDPSQMPQCIFTLTPTYAVVSSTISFYIPCIIMIGLYTKLYACAMKHVKNIQSINKIPAPIQPLTMNLIAGNSTAQASCRTKLGKKNNNNNNGNGNNDDDDKTNNLSSDREQIGANGQQHQHNRIKQSTFSKLNPLRRLELLRNRRGAQRQRVQRQRLSSGVILLETGTSPRASKSLGDKTEGDKLMFKKDENEFGLAGEIVDEDDNATNKRQDSVRTRDRCSSAAVSSMEKDKQLDADKWSSIHERRPFLNEGSSRAKATSADNDDERVDQSASRHIVTCPEEESKFAANTMTEGSSSSPNYSASDHLNSSRLEGPERQISDQKGNEIEAKVTNSNTFNIMSKSPRTSGSKTPTPVSVNNGQSEIHLVLEKTEEQRVKQEEQKQDFEHRNKSHKEKVDDDENEKVKDNQRDIELERQRQTIRKLQQQQIQYQLQQQQQQQHPSNHLATHKAAITLGIIMGTFLFCWVPFFCLNIIKAFCVDCIPGSIFRAFTWLGYANSALNPIIYGIHNSEFRNAFNRIFFKHLFFRRGNSSNRRYSFDIRNKPVTSRRNRVKQDKPSSRQKSETLLLRP